MIKKSINIMVIIIVVIFICVYEDILVSSTLKQMDERCNVLQSLVMPREDINSQDILTLVESLDEFWRQKEGMLCFLVNHKDIEEIGMEISKMKSNISTNAVEDFKTSLALIRYYTNGYLHMMGASFHNIL